MKRDSDIISDLMQWIFYQPLPGEPNPSGDFDFPLNVSDQLALFREVFHRNSEGLDQLDVEDDGMADYGINNPEAFEVNLRSGMNPISNSGDIPAVQNHFESLLKRRLRQEIEQHPPLFPWEMSVDDYPDVVTSDISTASVWLNHLKSLDIPSTLPDEVLSCLLSRCQELAQQTLQSGVRLIKAVEDLFPDQPSNLGQIASMVAMPAYRSAQSASMEQIDYETATEQQQAALAMMAARAIFDSLELTLSPQQPRLSREWLTELGPLTLTVAYVPNSAESLQVRVNLPAEGKVCLSHDAQVSAAERRSPGALDASLAGPQVGQSYALTVHLGSDERAALQFLIAIKKD